MRAPFVKVCGITRLEDARAAVAAGARAIGFVFVSDSPRWIDPARAAEIARLVPQHIARVGVVRDLDAATLRALATRVSLTAFQLHGRESPEFLDTLPLPAIKAFAAGPGFDPARLEPYRDYGVLLDGGTEEGRGGTGTTADWDVARMARDKGFRVLLAGGLAPDNVARAVKDVKPLAIDLNSGVEIAPGRKDRALIQEAMLVLSRFDPPEASAWPW